MGAIGLTPDWHPALRREGWRPPARRVGRGWGSGGRPPMAADARSQRLWGV